MTKAKELTLREQIASLLFEYLLCRTKENSLDIASKILALGLYQLDEDQDVPGFISNPEDWTVEDAEYETTRRLREAGWRKVKEAK